MKTVSINLFSFDELSEAAKENAIKNHRNKAYDYSHYFDEIIGSTKAVADLFNLKFGREYTDLRYSHLDDDILNLQGVRLYKYILNNYGHELFKPKYIKTVEGEYRKKFFICKVRTARDGSKYTQLYSRTKKDNSCVLTGTCYDEDILKPVYDFLKHPDKHTTFSDIFDDIENAIQGTFESTEEWINSDEFIGEELEANNYEFTEDGEQF